MLVLSITALAAFASTTSTPAERLTRCPAEHPFAYSNGYYCCKTGQSANSADNVHCSGGPLTYTSVCCFEKEFINCTSAPCVSAPENVNCGKSKASFCAQCGKKENCSGDCEWRHDLCQPKRPVKCGSHVAEVCADCPRGKGKDNCGGDCTWTNEKCILRTDTPAWMWDNIIALVMGIIFALIFLLLLFCCLRTSRKNQEKAANKTDVNRLSNQTVERLPQHGTQSSSEVMTLAAPESTAKEQVELAPLTPPQEDLSRLTTSPDALPDEDEIEAAKLKANPNLDADPDRKHREALTHEIVHVGQRVVRGPDWEYQNQDGGKGNVGVVGSIPTKGWVMVKWEKSGTKHAYKTGEQGVFHLSPAPPEIKVTRADSKHSIKE